MRFNLSNRQRRELFVRAKQITVAIPVPPCEPDDCEDYARSVFGPDVAECVQHVEREDLLVRPATSRDGLTAVLGDIWHGEPDDLKQFSAWIDAFVVTLIPRHGSRHRDNRPSWPLSCKDDEGRVVGD